MLWKNGRRKGNQPRAYPFFFVFGYPVIDDFGASLLCFVPYCMLCGARVLHHTSFRTMFPSNRSLTPFFRCGIHARTFNSFSVFNRICVRFVCNDAIVNPKSYSFLHKMLAVQTVTFRTHHPQRHTQALRCQKRCCCNQILSIRHRSEINVVLQLACRPTYLPCDNVWVDSFCGGVGFDYPGPR